MLRGGRGGGASKIGGRHTQDSFIETKLLNQENPQRNKGSPSGGGGSIVMECDEGETIIQQKKVARPGHDRYFRTNQGRKMLSSILSEGGTWGRSLDRRVGGRLLLKVTSSLEGKGNETGEYCIALCVGSVCS